MKNTPTTMILLAAMALTAAAGEFDARAKAWYDSVPAIKGQPLTSTNDWNGTEAAKLQADIAAKPADAISPEEARYIVRRGERALLTDQSQWPAHEAALRAMLPSTNALVRTAATTKLIQWYAGREEIDAWVSGGWVAPDACPIIDAAATRLGDDALRDAFFTARTGSGQASAAWQKWFRASLAGASPANTTKAVVKELKGLIHPSVKLDEAGDAWLHELRLKLAIAEELRAAGQ